MPWHKVDNHPQCPASRPIGVVKDDDGELEGCHASDQDADRQLAALYATEERSVTVTETKRIGVVDLAVKALDGQDPNGEFEAVLSAPTEDRDGEIIDAKAFEPLPERIPIDVDHALSVDGTVGSGVPFYDGDVLKVRGAFSSIPRAQEVRTLVTEGHITKMSVAFMDADRADVDGKTHIRNAELLNAAFVAIPSNREASVLAAKAALKVGARNSAKDSELLQTAHDCLVSAGASCEAKSATADDTKTSTATETAEAAAPAAASPPDVTVARAFAFAAEAHLMLTD